MGPGENLGICRGSCASVQPRATVACAPTAETQGSARRTDRQPGAEPETFVAFSLFAQDGFVQGPSRRAPFFARARESQRPV